MNIDPEHFFELVKQFKQSYIAYNLKPDESSKYQLDSIKIVVDQKSGVLVSTINSLTTEIKNAIAKTVQESQNADKIKKLYYFLNDKKKNLDGIDRRSKMLITNFQELYKIQYFINVLLFLGILIISYNLNKKE